MIIFLLFLLVVILVGVDYFLARGKIQRVQRGYDDELTYQPSGEYKPNNKFRIAASSLVCALTLFSFVKGVSPGYVGVVVNLWGDEKGVQSQEKGVGYHIIPPWKQLYVFPVFEQNFTWERPEDVYHFQTKEGLPMSAKMGVTFHLEEDKVHLLFCKYRRGMDEITHVFVHNNIRDAINMHASRFGIEDLYSTSKEEFFRDVQNEVAESLKGVGIRITRIYLIGNLIFPESVASALNQKIEATQRAQQRENELREAEAQAKKSVAEKEGEARSIRIMAEAQAAKIEVEARAQANANLALAKSLTPELVQSQKIQKWNGILPQYVGVNSAMPFIDMGKDNVTRGN